MAELEVTTETTFSWEAKHIEWKILNFFEAPTEDGYILNSACFNAFDAIWYFRIYTNGSKEYNTSGWVGLHLIKKEALREHRIHYRIGIKHIDGSVFIAAEHENAFSIASGWGHRQLIKRKNLMNAMEDVVANGFLTVFGTLQDMDKPRLQPSLSESETQTAAQGTTTLMNNLHSLFRSGSFTDLTITVKNKEFRVHRNIISCRSSVLGSMLLDKSVEDNGGIIEISDSDPDTFEDFLLFLYTGKFEYVTAKTAMSLYMLANKYDIKELKEGCVNCLIRELSDDKFCDYLRFSVKNEQQELLRAITEYFRKNAENIVKTVKWQEYIVDYPLTANQLFTAKLGKE